jgi:hypothetical protein
MRTEPKCSVKLFRKKTTKPGFVKQSAELTYSYLKLVLRPMRYLERCHGAEKVKRHVGNRCHVTFPNAHRDAADNEVRVANGLHLTDVAKKHDSS